MTNIRDAQAMADFLGLPLHGENLHIDAARPIESMAAGAVGYARTVPRELPRSGRGLVVAGAGLDPAAFLPHAVILTDNPRRAFGRVLRRFFAPTAPEGIDPSAVVSPQAQLDAGVSIGPGAVIGATVEVGANTHIAAGAVLRDVTLGPDCVVHEGACLGVEGFGFERDDDGSPVDIPHLGRLVLERDVRIGAGATLARGTLGDTRIGAGTRISHGVNIGHNVRVGRNCTIAGNAQVSGSVVVEDDCWLGPNCSIAQKVTIGRGSTVGIGVVVLRSMAPGTGTIALDGLDRHEYLRLRATLGTRS